MSNLSQEQTTINRDQLLVQWLDSKRALEVAKEREAALRKQIVESAGFDLSKLEGTERLELGNGYELKAVKKLTYTLDVAKVDSALDKIEATGPAGKLIAERLVKFKPELSVREYKELDPKFKKIIDSVLTVKSGMPTLELIEPKAK